MASSRARFSLVEYGAPVDVAKRISEVTGLQRGQANQLLIDAGARAAGVLGFTANPFSIEVKGARIADVAGLIRLGPSLELEIAPKFLGLDGADARWREDFFFLSTLSRHGRLLASERISSTGGETRDLVTLVARAFADMYQARKRRPLRTYRRVKEMDFFLDGDTDPVDLLFPEPDGFEQEIIRFDRNNAWNGTIFSAAKELLPELSDAAVAAAIVRVIEDLAPQSSRVSVSRRPIPARHRSWSALYELSVDVLDGLGLTYKQGHAHAPGYLVSTWQVWEDLLTIASRLGFGRSDVSAQKGFILGSRVKSITPLKPSPLSVFPDCAIEARGDMPRFLLDAKYKGNVERGPLRIAESDIYEAMAFAKAADAKHVVLAYPALPNTDSAPPGTCFVFERVEVGHVRIIGVQVEVRGISRSGALKRFSTQLAAGLSGIIAATN